MIQVAYDELYKMADSSCLSSAYDLIRTDMAWMDKIGKDLYCEMDWKNAEISEIIEKLIPGLLEKYSEFNGKIYGFPLDACVQMLFYRKDLFENELIKREYYEKNRKRLEIPKTFQQFNQIARFFCKNSIRSRQYNMVQLRHMDERFWRVVILCHIIGNLERIFLMNMEK